MPAGDRNQPYPTCLLPTLLSHPCLQTLPLQLCKPVDYTLYSGPLPQTGLVGHAPTMCILLETKLCRHSASSCGTSPFFSVTWLLELLETGRTWFGRRHGYRQHATDSPNLSGHRLEPRQAVPWVNFQLLPVPEPSLSHYP